MTTPQLYHFHQIPKLLVGQIAIYFEGFTRRVRIQSTSTEKDYLQICVESIDTPGLCRGGITCCVGTHVSCLGFYESKSGEQWLSATYSHRRLYISRQTIDQVVGIVSKCPPGKTYDDDYAFEQLGFGRFAGINRPGPIASELSTYLSDIMWRIDRSILAPEGPIK